MQTTIPPILVLLSLVVALIPFVIFLFLLFFGKRLYRQGAWLAISGMGIGVALAGWVFFKIWPNEVVAYEWEWFTVANYTFKASVLVDKLSVFMLALVTFISLLVQLYSTAYMKGDKHYSRYFAYLGLFTSAMLGIILAKNLLLMYIAWELVGVASYLLIGFWYEKPDAYKASRNAFLINRIGDVGFLIGILVVYFQLDTLDILTLSTKDLTSVSPFWITLAGLGLFCGCIAKSAQFPLQIWLPGAMAGPTPVSALIHAATMVAAGVFLVARVYPLFTPDVLTFIAITGTITAFMGAFAALFQTDIKRLLAFSTISQLGYMVMGMGVGAYGASLFHLLTHAFFKACLFLSAGAVIHALHKVEHHYHVNLDTQDMRIMGGLRKQMPFTFACYSLAGFSLAGLPFFSGFLSKDAILAQAITWADQKGSFWWYAIPDVGFITALLTAVYVGRQLLLVFFGEFRLEKINTSFKGASQFIEEVPLAMKVPIGILGMLSLFFFFSFNPFSAENSWFMQAMPHLKADHSNHLFAAITSGILSVIGLATAYFLTGRSRIRVPLFIRNLSLNNWYLDTIYKNIFIKPGVAGVQLARWMDSKVVDKIIDYTGIGGVVLAHIIAWVDRAFVDGFVNFTAFLAGRIGVVTKSIQGGNVQLYFVSTLVGLILLVVWIIL